LDAPFARAPGLTLEKLGFPGAASRCRTLLVAVVLGVGLGCLTRVVHRVFLVTMGHLSMMCGLLIVAGFVMLRSLPVMTASMLVMFGCLMMMICYFLSHISP